jgi:exopolyphosphatase / guanosine-5'-triphosphate,3'-diphosphate pyrophosphatase
MRIASLDLGSNSFLLLIADIENGRIDRVLCDELRVTKLGEKVNATRRLQPEALDRADQCFAEFSKIIAESKPDRTVAMATSAARDAQNGAELFALGKKFGIPISIVPGDVEARVSFRGATFDRPRSMDVAVIDVGGGSTEVVFEESESHQLIAKSVDIGSVRLTEMFVHEDPVPGTALAAMEEHLRKACRGFPPIPFERKIEFVAVAGTPTTLAAIAQNTDYRPDLVHGYKLKLNELRAVRDDLARMTLAQRKSVQGMDPRRAEVIVAGATVLLNVGLHYGTETLTVSDKGVRYGLALEAEAGLL